MVAIIFAPGYGGEGLFGESYGDDLLGQVNLLTESLQLGQTKGNKQFR